MERNGRDRWLDWAMRLQSIAQAGLAYSTDKYDLERFQQVRDLAAEIMSEHTGLEFARVRDLFCNETGYQTPKVDVRAVVIEDGRILLVRETIDGRWTLPGGWAEVNLTVRENVVKEMKEEAGLDVIPLRLLAVLDRSRHNFPAIPYGVYKVFVLCRRTGGSFRPNIETSESGFFPPDGLPELSTGRVTEEQIVMCFDAADDPHHAVIFD